MKIYRLEIDPRYKQAIIDTSMSSVILPDKPQAWLPQFGQTLDIVDSETGIPFIEFTSEKKAICKRSHKVTIRRQESGYSEIETWAIKEKMPKFYKFLLKCELEPNKIVCIVKDRKLNCDSFSSVFVGMCGFPSLFDFSNYYLPSPGEFNGWLIDWKWR